MSPLTANLNIASLDTGYGLVSFDAAGESKRGMAQFTGHLKGEKLKLAPNGSPAARPVEFEFALDHNLRKNSGRLHKGEIHIGAAPANLTGSYAEEGESTVFHMRLAGTKMPVPELAAMLPGMGIVLPKGSSLQGGTATIALSMDGPLERLVTAGDVSLDNTKLAGFDMGKKMAVVESLAGIKGGPDTEIQTFASTLRMSPTGITSDRIRLIIPAIGNLEGSGSVSPSNALDFHMRAAVHTSGMLSSVADHQIPFRIEGPATDPVFRPDLKSLATQEVKSNATKAATGLLKGLLGGKK
jgi:AsmA protein